MATLFPEKCEVPHFPEKYKAFTFAQMFERELCVVNFRRRMIQSGEVAEQRQKATESAAVKHLGHQQYLRQRRAVCLAPGETHSNQRSVSLAGESDLTGLALSGGGIRSAAFCLGVLQALDSLSDHTEPHVLDAIDYMSAVSGGGYIGTSLATGMMRPDYTFPFDSQIGKEETGEMQHLRDYSNFLAPNGLFDYLTSGIFVFRGLLVNAAMILPIVLFWVLCTIFFNPTITNLAVPNVGGRSFSELHIPNILGWRGFVGTTYLVIALMLAFLLRPIWTSFICKRRTLLAREWGEVGLGWAVIGVVVFAIFESQSVVLTAIFEHVRPAPAGQHCGAGLWTCLPIMLSAAFEPVYLALTTTFGHIGLGHPANDARASSLLSWVTAALIPAVTLLITFGQRLANIAKATLGETTWQGAIKKHASQFALYLAAVIVPLSLWVVYIYLTLWAVRSDTHTDYNAFTPNVVKDLGDKLASVPMTHCLVVWFGRVGALYLVVGILLAAISFFLSPNANSLHRLYRDRLSRAFLMGPTKNDKIFHSFIQFLLRRRKDDQIDDVFDRLSFSSLKPRELNPGKKAGWAPEAAYSPYLLLNTAINLESSPELNKRGRNADTFLFSPLHVGSHATKYVPTRYMEAQSPDLGLATAMATSGAAASANMGWNTIKILTFSLTILNIRLGYWLPNPGKLLDLADRLKRRWANFGIWYFALETFGFLSEKKLNVYLTDGGHIENLGIYELLRRRCKVIVAVDAEADQEMSFPSFVRLQVLARIDLGILIDLPWPPLQAEGLKVTDKVLHGPKGWPGSNGPHAAIGRIDYGEGESGVLIYIKASMSGDESDYLIDYKRRNDTFPHETTVDQFFSEEQFEVYRALGFHAARRLFTGSDRVATFVNATDEWREAVRHALALLNVPRAMANRLVARC